MKRLDADDVSALLAFVGELKDVDDLLPFPPRVLRGLKALIQCDAVSYSELDPLRRRSRLQVWTDGCVDGVESGDLTGDLFELFWELRPTHPMCGYRLTSGNWTDPLKTSDFTTLDGFRRTALYDTLYRGELNHWFDFGLPAEPDRTRVFIFVRHKSADFTERDRLVAKLLGPHLEARAREVEATARATAALVGAQEEEGSATDLLVLCTSGGVIEFASPVARALLGRYLGIDNGQVPAALLGKDRLVLADGGRRLTIRVARTGGLRLLMLDERDLRVDRLTSREREILGLVALGRTNAEISAELGVAYATVAKHLEHVYDKLGVRSRTGAAALVNR